MIPPIHELPEGEWYCPLCTNMVQADIIVPIPLEMVVDEDPQEREGSPIGLTKGRPRKKVLILEEEEEEEEEDEEDEEVAIARAIEMSMQEQKDQNSQKK